MKKTTISRFANKAELSYNYVWGLIDKNKKELLAQDVISEETVRVNSKIYIIDEAALDAFMKKTSPEKKGIKKFISSTGVNLSYVSVWNIINRNKTFLVDNNIVKIEKHLSKKKIEVTDPAALASFIKELSE